MSIYLVSTVFSGHLTSVALLLIVSSILWTEPVSLVHFLLSQILSIVVTVVTMVTEFLMLFQSLYVSPQCNPHRTSVALLRLLLLPPSCVLEVAGCRLWVGASRAIVRRRQLFVIS